MPNGLSPYEPYRRSTYYRERLDDLPPNHPHVPKMRTGLTHSQINETLMEASVLLLRAMKKDLNVSVRKLAQMAGCSPASVSNDLAGQGDLARVLQHILNLGGTWNLKIDAPATLTYGKSASAMNPHSIMVTSHPNHASPTSSSSSSSPTSTESAPASEQTDTPNTPT